MLRALAIEPAEKVYPSFVMTGDSRVVAVMGSSSREYKFEHIASGQDAYKNLVGSKLTVAEWEIEKTSVLCIGQFCTLLIKTKLQFTQVKVKIKL